MFLFLSCSTVSIIPVGGAVSSVPKGIKGTSTGQLVTALLVPAP